MKLIVGKKGEMLYIYLIFIVGMLMIICIFSIVIFKMSITSKIITLKKDLFYIGQNCSSIALENNLLSYNEYKIDETKMYNLASKLINENYGSNVKLDSIDYNYSNNIVTINVSILIDSKITFFDLGVVSIPVSEDIKVKLMEVSE